jgi:hypothetical protein
VMAGLALVFVKRHTSRIIPRAGVPGFRGSGVPGFRSSEVPKFWSSGVRTPEPQNL